MAVTLTCPPIEAGGPSHTRVRACLEHLAPCLLGQGQARPVTALGWVDGHLRGMSTAHHHPEGPGTPGFLQNDHPGHCEGHSPHNSQPGDGEHEGRLVVVNHVLGQVPEVQGPGGEETGSRRDHGQMGARRAAAQASHVDTRRTAAGRAHSKRPGTGSSPSASPTFPPPDPLLDGSGEQERGACHGGLVGTPCHPTPKSKGAAGKLPRTVNSP